MEMANAVLMAAWSIHVLCGIIACDTSRMMADFDTTELCDRAAGVQRAAGTDGDEAGGGG